MLKKYLVLGLTVLLVNLFLVTSISAKTKGEKEIKFAEKVKASITKLGTGKEAQVEVKIKDGTKLKGYIAEINKDNFVVRNAKNGTATAVPYGNAKQIKGNNLSTGAKIVIAVGLIVGLVALTIIAGRS